MGIANHLVEIFVFAQIVAMSVVIAHALQLVQIHVFVGLELQVVYVLAQKKVD